MADQSRDALDRLWDDLVRDRPTSSEALDPALADAVHIFHAAEDVDGPSPDFVARLQEDLMPTHASTLSRTLQPTMTIVPNGHVTAIGGWSPAPAPTRPTRHMGFPARLLLAAVVALAIVVGLVALDPDRRREERGGDVVPAALLEATPSRSSADATHLASLTLPADIVEARGTVSLGMTHFSIPAGSESAGDSSQRSCCPGARIHVLLSGRVTVTVDGPSQAVSAGGAVRAIPAGEPVELAAGDTLATRYEHADRWSNGGADPARVLQATFTPGPISGSAGNAGWSVLGVNIRDIYNLAPGAYTVTVERRELATGETIPPPPAGSHHLAVPESAARVYVTRDSDASLHPHSSDGTTGAAATLFYLHFSPAGPDATPLPLSPPGTPAATPTP